MTPVALVLLLPLLAMPGVRRVDRFAHAGPGSARAAAVVRGPSLAAGPSVALPSRQADRWIAEDKLRHFSMSFAITAMGYGFGRTVLPAVAARTAAGAAAIGAGIGKEVHDRRAGRWFSFKDLTWDAAGVALGLTLAHQIH